MMLQRVLNLTGKFFRFLGYLRNPGIREMKYATEALLLAYGHSRSWRARVPIDKEGNPLPWITYPAIEYLDGIDFSDKIIFEYGSGNSSAWWGKRAKHIASVENDPSWYERVRQNKAGNQEIELETDLERYPSVIDRTGRKYDVIVIDGQRRLECSRIAPRYLNTGGMIMLDNSDWFPDATAVLRDADLIQVDFAGFCPVNQYTSCTSLFLRRDVQLSPRTQRLPLYSKAALKQLGADDDARPAFEI